MSRSIRWQISGTFNCRIFGYWLKHYPKIGQSLSDWNLGAIFVLYLYLTVWSTLDELRLRDYSQLFYSFLSISVVKEKYVAIIKKYKNLFLFLISNNEIFHLYFVTKCTECIEQHSIFIHLVLSNWRALGVAQCLATLQRPVMVISSQSTLSMSVWVCGPIRAKSDDVTSGWVSWLMQTYSYTPPQATPVEMPPITWKRV